MRISAIIVKSVSRVESEKAISLNGTPTVEIGSPDKKPNRWLWLEVCETLLFGRPIFQVG
jgi:hypothetical protein